MANSSSIRFVSRALVELCAEVLNIMLNIMLLSRAYVACRLLRVGCGVIILLKIIIAGARRP